MILYHGSDVLVKNPILIKSNRTFENKFMDFDTVIKELRTYKLDDQISFHTEEALEKLKFIGYEEV